MKTIKQIKESFLLKWKKREYIKDKSNVLIIELMGESFLANEESIFGKVNYNYLAKESNWYLSQSLNVYDMEDPPKIWKEICGLDGCINSNYGWIMFNQENHNQYIHVLNTLILHKDSRRAVAIYNRPSMQIEFNKHGMSDFICTNAVNYLIRDNELHCVVQMRSNDVVYGYKNDRAWQYEILSYLYKDLKKTYPNLKIGNIIWNASSLHIYERHFKYIKENK